MEVIGILGDRGSFKSCFMTAALWRDHLDGEKITANYRLSFPHQRRTFQQVRDELRLMEKTQDTDKPHIPSFKGNILAFTELSTGADSYEFMLTHTAELTWLVSQIRKLGCIMYYDDQRYGKVVKRIRDQTDVFYLMRDLDKGKMTHPDGRKAKRHRDVCDGISEYVIVDSDLEPVGDGNRVRFDGRPFYDKYDTDELIFDKRT